MKRIAVILSSLLAVTGCSGGGLFSDGKIPVSVQKMAVNQRQASFSLPAVLSPGESVDISFPVDVKVDKFVVKLGDKVAAGDPLLFLDEQDFRISSGQLKTKLMEQEAMAEKNGYFLKNRDRLLDEGKIDQSMFDTLESEVKTLEAKVTLLKGDIARMDNMVQNVRVAAPFGGIVAAKNGSDGARFVAGQNLLTLVQNNPMVAAFQMKGSDAAFVAPEMSVAVEVEGFDGPPLQAGVTFVSPAIEKATQTLEVRATLPNGEGNLKGGTSATVHFTSPKWVRVFTLPSQAVLSEGNKEYVYVVRENKAWPVRIFTKKSLDDPNSVEVLEGLTPQDMVVTEGFDKLKAGAEVNLWH